MDPGSTPGISTKISFFDMFKRTEYKFIVDLLKPYKWYLVWMCLINLVLSAVGLVIPYLTKLQTDQLQKSNSSFFGVITGAPFGIFILIVGIIFVFNGLDQLFGYISRWLGQKISYKLGHASENNFFKKLEHLDLGFLSNTRNRRMVSNIFNVSWIFERALYILPDYLRALLNFFGVIPLVIIIDYRIGLLAFAISLGEYLLSKVRINEQNQLTVANDSLSQKVNELRYLLLYNFQRIRLVDNDDTVLKSYQQKQHNVQAMNLAKFKNQEKWNSLSWLLSNINTVAITAIFGYRVLQGDFTIGDFMMITLYALQLKSAFGSLFKSANDWRSLELDFLKLGFFLSLKSRTELVKPAYDGEISGDIIFDKVNFRYPNLDQDEKNYVNFLIEKEAINSKKFQKYFYDQREEEQWKALLESTKEEAPLILKDFSITLKRGQITALIGPNGSGKTTATNLILRSYDPEQGEVLVHKTSLKRIDPTRLRNFVSVLTQEVFLIESFSVRENLLLGVQREVGDEEIWKLLKRFFLFEKINELPKKLDTILGDEMQFSGGQRQLFAIVRTCLQARSLIIFDEGTNQLDAEHEARIVEFLQEFKHKSTILMITHKLTSARKADHIYVMEKGQVIESGNHAGLLEKGGLYSKYWKLQVVD